MVLSLQDIVVADIDAQKDSWHSSQMGILGLRESLLLVQAVTGVEITRQQYISVGTGGGGGGGHRGQVFINCCINCSLLYV